MVVLDTSILFALFHRKDVHHKRAVELLGELKEIPFMPRMVFDELMTLLTYKVSSTAAISLGTKLMAKDSPVHWIEPDAQLNGLLWKSFCQEDPHQLSMTDSLLLTLNHHFGCRVLSFDKELNERLVS